MRYELRSILKESSVWILLMMLLFTAMMLIGYSSKKEKESYGDIALASDFAIQQAKIQGQSTDHLKYWPEAQDYSEGIDAYTELHKKLYEELEHISEAYKLSINRPRSREFQQARTSYYLWYWLLETHYNSNYKSNSTLLSPQDYYGNSEWNELNEALGIEVLDTYKAPVPAIGAIYTNHFIAEARYQVDLYHRGYVHISRDAVNGFVFNLALGQPFHMAVYLLLTLFLTYIALQHFHRQKLDLVLTPVIGRKRLYKKKLVLALSTSILLLFGSEFLTFLIRILLDPGVALNHPVRIVKLNRTLELHALEPQVFHQEILPIAIGSVEDLSALTTMPLGCLVVLGTFYRILVLSLVSSMFSFVWTVFRVAKKLTLILFTLSAMVVIFMLFSCLGSDMLLRLISPNELFQGKGPLSFMHASLLGFSLLLCSYKMASYIATKESLS